MRKKLILSDKSCLQCGNIFGRNSCKSVADYKEKKFCSKQCYYKYNSGENNYNFKTGYRTRSDGYIRDSNDNYVHRLVMEEHLGRKLRSDEHVHHIDENKSNNNIENLEIKTNSNHRKLHVIKQKRNNEGKFSI